MKRFLLPRLLFLPVVALSASMVFAQQYSLRFYGTAYKAIGEDLLKVPIDHPNRPVDVAKDFTIEFWMKASYRENNREVAAENITGNGWKSGNVIIDRSMVGDGDYGEYGLAIGSNSPTKLTSRVVAFGIDQRGKGVTIVGNTNVADNKWHHIAVTRVSYTGKIKLFVDGNVDAEGVGPTWHIDYANNRATNYPESDPFLVLGAMKNESGMIYPCYNGFLDEMRVCSNIRYHGEFTPPTVEFGPDQKTVAIYHFNEGTGTTVHDNSEFTMGSSDGTMYVGGNPPGPEWSTESPFDKTDKTQERVISSFTGVSVFPNPSRGGCNITLPEDNMLVVIYDALGHEIYVSRFSGAGNYSVPLPGKMGSYYVAFINSSGEKVVKPLLLQ